MILRVVPKKTAKTRSATISFKEFLILARRTRQVRWPVGWASLRLVLGVCFFSPGIGYDVFFGIYKYRHGNLWNNCETSHTHTHTPAVVFWHFGGQEYLWNDENFCIVFNFLEVVETLQLVSSSNVFTADSSAGPALGVRFWRWQRMIRTCLARSQCTSLKLT